MKTKTKNFSYLLTSFVVAATLIFSSCNDDSEKSSPAVDPGKKATAEKVLGFRQELDFINRFVSDNVRVSVVGGGRQSFAGTIISRMKDLAPCTEATEEISEDGTIKITLDFGDGCQTEDGIDVAGAVAMIFSFTETTISFELEFTNYSELSGENEGDIVNGTVSGSFVMDFESGKFIQEMEQDLTITYPDNTEARYVLAQSAELTEDGLRVNSLTTSGNFADGGEFSVTVVKTLVYDFSCEGDLPVEGEELVIFQGNTIRVNYGNGTCDNAYTVN